MNLHGAIESIYFALAFCKGGIERCGPCLQIGSRLALLAQFFVGLGKFFAQRLFGGSLFLDALLQLFDSLVLLSRERLRLLQSFGKLADAECELSNLLALFAIIRIEFRDGGVAPARVPPPQQRHSFVRCEGWPSARHIPIVDPRVLWRVTRRGRASPLAVARAVRPSAAAMEPLFCSDCRLAASALHSDFRSSNSLASDSTCPVFRRELFQEALELCRSRRTVGLLRL